MSTIEERVAALEDSVERLEEIVDEGTEAGKYTAVVEQLMEKYGWTAEEATRNFNNILNQVAAGGIGGAGTEPPPGGIGTEPDAEPTPGGGLGGIA